MEIQESIYLGVVMGWEPKPTPNCNEPFTFSPPVVTEFCSGNLQSGKIQPSQRMRELAEAGFAPIAIVYRDSVDEDHYLFERNGISDAAHMQLLEDAEAILKAAAECAPGEAQRVPLPAEGQLFLQSKTSVVHHG